MLKLRNHIITAPALAPMAGFTDSAFRRLCREHGAGLVFSEMISAKALCYGDRKTDLLCRCQPQERPLSFQLFGNEPETMAQAAQMLCERSDGGPELIDLNMGCPVPKIVGSGGGSALLREPKLAGEIVSAVVRRVRVPVSVKIRIGWDEESRNAPELARRLEDCGAALITVHGRTRDQMYTPPVNRAAIADVCAAVRVPVIGNGDVTDVASMRRMYEETGCALVMVGRGALGNPLLFERLSAVSDGRPEPPEPTLQQRMQALQQLCEWTCEQKGERLGMLELRRHLPFFFRQLRGGAQWRRRSCCVSSRRELEAIIADVLAANTVREEL